MSQLKPLLKKLKSKSNIIYKYYHLFNNCTQDFKEKSVEGEHSNNHIIYIIGSAFSLFLLKYQEIQNESITDVFLERINFSEIEKQTLFQMKFKNLFWLKINNIVFDEKDYGNLIDFLSLNGKDINRVFLENMSLGKAFFLKFSQLNNFGNLGFLNFDNNKMSDEGLEVVLSFLKRGNTQLEYLSLINTGITNIENLLNYLSANDSIRIIDISSNKISTGEGRLISELLSSNKNLREIYLKNIIFTDEELIGIIDYLNSENVSINTLRLSLTQEQEEFYKTFKSLSNKLDINIQVNIDNEDSPTIYSTIYIKGLPQNSCKELNRQELESPYFYTIVDENSDSEFNTLTSSKNKALLEGINLFLFDFHDYSKIEYLLSRYNFNYIYLENYFISDENLQYFIDILKQNYTKTYKVNLISIDISEIQLLYLIENIPKNIFYIEVNLNGITDKRELYISKMLQNEAFIFENMELYKKVFK